jgi:sulfoacetaldehyde dehydrogenase
MADPANVDPIDAEQSDVDAICRRARDTQRDWAARADQAMLDRAALAAAWSLMEPTRNQALSELAVATTGLGRVEDKVGKNHRKTLGLLRDIESVRTQGVIRRVPERGLTEIARPLGVVGAVVPSTNPLATPVNNTVNALKCGNAIVLSPSPKGSEACERLLHHMHAEFDKAGVPRDLVQMLPRPSSKAKTHRLMQLVDLVVVTGSQANVRAAYSSGTPAIGVGAGNVAVIIDETADPTEAAAKIAASKCFDNATSCSSENALVVIDDAYDSVMTALEQAGGALLTGAERERLIAAHWRDGRLNPAVLAKDIQVLAGEAGLDRLDLTETRFVMTQESGIGPGHPMSGEKMSLALAVYRARDFDDAKTVAARLLDHEGAGHSVGLHTRRTERALELGLELPTCRVIVNQAHCFATGGSFDNGLPFSLSMGCGSWGGNSIDGNLHWRHFLNVTRVVETIPSREPELETVFGPYWESVGR